MGSLRKTICNSALCLTIVFQAQNSRADISPPDPIYFFATCTGRLSALIEHQWLMQDPASAQTEAWRDGMESLLDSVMPAGRSSEVMGWRVEAKWAQADLLSRASFSPDPVASAWAEQRAALLVSECMAMVLS